MKTEYKFLLKFADVECEVLFRGLDDAERRAPAALAAGVFRYPRRVPGDQPLQSSSDAGPSRALPVEAGQRCRLRHRRRHARTSHLWGMSNPPDMDTFWERFLTDPPANAHVLLPAVRHSRPTPTGRVPARRLLRPTWRRGRPRTGSTSTSTPSSARPSPAAGVQVVQARLPRRQDPLIPASGPPTGR
jgi:hypothetical protein